jgi:hypothetical protein
MAVTSDMLVCNPAFQWDILSYVIGRERVVRRWLCWLGILCYILVPRLFVDGGVRFFQEAVCGTMLFSVCP